jgi:hypothetical protein
LPYALDNGAFVAWEKRKPWDDGDWRRLLIWAAFSGQRPLWSIVPDVVADRAAARNALPRLLAAYRLQERVVSAARKYRDFGRYEDRCEMEDAISALDAARAGRGEP